MPCSLSRRSLLGAAASTFAGACASAPDRPAKPAEVPSVFAALEAKVGGRVGVFAVDLKSGLELAHRADERFAMCSTFKWALAAAVLARVDRGELGLGQELAFGEADLLDYAPSTRAKVGEGKMTIEALAEAAVTVSDNTAANLLLGVVGGPAGMTRFFRELGDEMSRLDRDEPALNTNLPGDPRDTTSPRAMVEALRAALLGEHLGAGSRERLTGWLLDCKTGADRLPAGLPVGWRIGHKTGSGERGAVNDVGVIWPPSGGPVFVAAYLSESEAPAARLAAAHAEIARVVVARASSPRSSL